MRRKIKRSEEGRRAADVCAVFHNALINKLDYE